jgi:hypothetical protein
MLDPIIIEPGSARYSVPVVNRPINWFSPDEGLLNLRATDLSTGNIATVRPAKPTLSRASSKVKSGLPAFFTLSGFDATWD